MATSAAESHKEFLTKCSNPLWTRSEFWVSLPLKKYEDLSPTKASHPGMSPEYLYLAFTELKDLQRQGLIEDTNSPWACQAFYVNKRSEQVCGKLRLVIDYRPLNFFLRDEQFPLPNRQAFFANLATAKIFSKFDLKAGFWQLGIKPEERFKTAFCIPDQHYQWTVMPFSLKTASSIFQKTVTRIFSLMVPHMLIYIDDLLIFSENPDDHLKHLHQFHQLLQQYGIMLSQRKCVFFATKIDFLRMTISNGSFELQPHISHQLLNFPDKDFSPKQVQQFLGIVNYMAEFIPKLASIIKPLQLLLKKDAPPWKDTHTKSVRQLKEMAKTLPSLHIPSSGKRILQTDASDQYWAAVFLEQQNDKTRKICGYKSGPFSPSEEHYYSTFKEIFAVKRGIEKFQFHLIGFHFHIEMDMASFPRMIQFK